MSEDKITSSSENKIGGVNDYEDDIPFVFKDQRKIKEAKPKNPKIIKILVCFIIGFTIFFDSIKESGELPSNKPIEKVS